MADVVDRQSLIERLVALHGRKESARAFYSGFTDAALVSAVEGEEAAAREIERRGSRLAAVWSETGGEDVSGLPVDRQQRAAE